MHQNNRLIDIAGQFRMDGVPSEVKALGDGFINDTYTVLIAGSPIRYILQRKNTAIFKDVPGMMSNIKAVTEHLKKKIADAVNVTENIGAQRYLSMTLLVTIKLTLSIWLSAEDEA